jgi:GAF domain-containing protein
VLAPQVAKGEDAAQVMSRRFKPGEGLVGWVFQQGESLLLTDATQDARFVPARRNRESPRSMLVVPVKSGDQTIGVISADQDARGWFNESALRLVEALALQAGIAIKRNIGLELLQDISNRVASMQDIDGILQEIVYGAIKLADVTTGVIYLISDDGQSVVKSSYPPGFDHPLPRLDWPEGLTRQVIQTGQVLSIPNAPSNPRVHPMLRGRFQSLIAVPLRLEQRVISVLYLDDEHRHDFTETEVSMLSTLASQAAIAIEKARLLEERKQRLDELMALHNTSLDIARQSDLERILQDILRLAVELLDAQGGGILLTYRRERTVRMAFTHNLDAMRDFTCKFGEGMEGRVAESGKPLIVDDYQTWPLRISNLGEEPYRHLLKAVAQVPLNWKNEIIGILFVSDSRRDKTFNQRDILTFRPFSLRFW